MSTENQSKVVVKFKDGTLMKGITSDFFANKKDFHLDLISGGTADINTEYLKAIFFVKDFKGIKYREDRYNDFIPGGGRKIRVEFFDGEILIGYSQGYSPNRQGFFMIPADKQSNNERIFVITSATKNVAFL